MHTSSGGNEKPRRSEFRGWDRGGRKEIARLVLGSPTFPILFCSGVSPGLPIPFLCSAGLNRKYAARSEYDKAICETENAFGKILESSKALLHVIKTEGNTLKAKVAE